MKKWLLIGNQKQHGFTLIELLVVIAILGTLSAVAIPNFANLMDSGKIEAANTELHNVQTAIIAYMINNNAPNLSGSIGPGHTLGPETYYLGQLQATYTVTDGVITAGVADPEGKWKGLVWSPSEGWH